MLDLKAFGGLSVVVDGAPASGAAQQRKTLALLALLAAAGRGGVSRDKLVAYLWPDADAEKARGLLKQACYALRRDLGQPDLFLGTSDLRLNPALITSDVQRFEAALERREDAEAARLYVGPFLDGFYLKGAGDFERWVEAERERRRHRAHEALERLAVDAGARGEHGSAALWWRRLAALDPLNSRVALGLMRALAAAGDPGGALQVARVHETLLREELDAAPDVAVANLASRLRAEAESSARPRHSAVSESAGHAVVAPDGAAAGATSADLTRAAPARIPTIRKPAALGTVIVAGGFLTAWLLFGTRVGVPTAESAREPKKLVVLPFANLGAPEDEYFAAGISEEITARLAGARGLRVIGTTSANVYKGARKAISEIGRELGVDYALEGSVRWQRSAQGPARVRVTLQLLNTADGTHLWAEVYDESLDEIFRVQSDIARKVVQALDVSLLDLQRHAAEPIPTRNLEAYDYYLRGRDYERRGTADARAAWAAVRMYERAVALDPDFAMAYATLSRLHSRIYLFYYDRSPERLSMAKRTVDRALGLTPGLPDGHHALASYYGFGLLDYDRALREFAIVEATRPNQAAVLLARGVLRVRQGRFPEALADHDRAWQLDPRSFQVANQYAQVYDLLRRFGAAEGFYDRAMALAPDQAVLYFWKTWLYLRWDGTTQRARSVMEDARAAGVSDDAQVSFARVMVELWDRKLEEAIGVLSAAPEVIAGQARFVPRAQLIAQVQGLMGRRELERAYYDSARALVARRIAERPDDARLHGALGIAYAGLGRKEEAIRAGRQGVELLPISREAYQGYYRVLDLARIYAMVGEADAAIDRLEQLLSIPGHMTAAWLRMDPTWDPLRSHPRFRRLLGRTP